MALSTVSGVESDFTILSNERVIDMDDVIAMLDPDTSQFTTMLMKVARGGAFSSKVQWLEDQLFPRLSAVGSGGYASQSTSTTVPVSTGQGAYFRVNDMLRNARTGECLLVTAVSGDNLTCNRALGSVAYAAGLSGDQLLIIGNSAPQGASLGTQLITQRVPQYNYTLIQRQPYGFTRTLMASKLYGGPEPNKERKKKAVEHKRAIEYTLFWGARSLNTTGSQPQGTAGGLFEFIATNVNNAAGSLTKTLLDTYMRNILQHGDGDNKVFFCSPVIALAISGFLRDAWQPVTTDARLWGAKVDGFISGAYGFRVPVVVKRDWNDFSTSSTQYGGWGFVVDMENMEYTSLRDTALLQDRQAPDADAYDEEYLTEFSCKPKVEQTHGIIQGVTG
jgi:hypothetical protein